MFTAHGRSDTGRQRSGNEDHYVCQNLDGLNGHCLIAAVADGMGGHAGGQIASEIAVQVLQSQVGALDRAPEPTAAARLLRAVYETANREILDRAAADLELADMGTTMVTAVVNDSSLTLANLGDSRAYLLRNGVLGQMTVDHSWREEARQHNMSEEEISMSPFRETITRSLGVDDAVKLDLVDVRLRPGDRILLCSDGVHDLLTDAEIRSALASPDGPEETSRRLIDEANAAGGYDNSTCVLVHVEATNASSELTAGVRSGVLES